MSEQHQDATIREKKECDAKRRPMPRSATGEKWKWVLKNILLPIIVALIKIIPIMLDLIYK